MKNKLKFFNSLPRQIQEFTPLDPKANKVGVYTCGPTVYSFVTIGNWRTYFLGDLVVRALKYFGYKVDYVMNITDVGHLTGDNLGDSSSGEDRQEMAAKKAKKSAWDLAKFYSEDFLASYQILNLTEPKVFCKATDHIPEQIDLIKKIEKKGFSYQIADGIYFDVAKYERAGHKYGELSYIDQVKEGARVEPNPEKKDPRDFALWKFSYPNGRSFDPAQDDAAHQRHMEWDSPWGVGFPGWHIECSAMSAKYLGEQFDIHIGGEDLRSTHHPNEIAQSECASGKEPFVKYWLHGAFLQIDGGRMGKSLGNAYTIQDIEKKGFEPVHLRYFYLTGHYRQPLNFTWDNLENSKRTFERLVEIIKKLKTQNSKLKVTSQKLKVYQNQFDNALKDDLNTPKVLAVLWEMLRDENLDAESKLELLKKWDQVLGLNLMNYESRIMNYEGQKSGVKIESEQELKPEIIDLIDQREIARHDKNWNEADKLRDQLQLQGFTLKDEEGKVVVR